MYDFLFVIIELFSLALTVEALQGKTCQDSLLSGGVGHLEPRFQGEGVVPGEYFFGFYKTTHILLYDSVNCTALRAVVLTQYRRVTDRWTDRRTDGQTARCKNDSQREEKWLGCIPHPASRPCPIPP